MLLYGGMEDEVSGIRESFCSPFDVTVETIAVIKQDFPAA